MRLNSTRRTARVTWLLTALFQAVAVAPSVMAATAMLDAIPARAPVLLMVKNLSTLNEKLARVNEQLGLELPALGDALEQFKSSIGIRQGFDEQGSFGLVLNELPLESAPNSGVTTQPSQDDPFSIMFGSGPPVFLLVPVTDHNQFIANYDSKSSEHGISTLLLPTGHTAYAKSITGFTIMGGDQDTMAAYKPGKAAATLLEASGKLGRQCLDRSDVALILNVGTVGSAMESLLDKSFDQSPLQFPGASSTPDMATQGQFTHIFEDLSVVIVAMDLAQKGIGITTTAQFKPGSDLAEIFKGGANAKVALAQLPEQSYISASAMDLSGVQITGILEEAIQLPANGSDPAHELLRTMLSILKQVKSVASLSLVPRNLIGGLPSMRILTVEDPRSCAEKIGQMITSLEGISVSVPPPPDGAPGEQGAADTDMSSQSVNVAYSSGVLVIDDVKVDQYAVNLPQDMITQIGQSVPMFSMLGLGKFTGYIAATDTHLIVTSTLDVQLVRQALIAVKESNGLGTIGPIAEVRTDADLSNATIEGYLSVSGLAKPVINFMNIIGQDLRLQIPADLPPIATGLHTENQGAALRVYVPTEVLQFGKEVASQFAGFFAVEPQQQGPRSRSRRRGRPQHRSRVP